MWFLHLLHRSSKIFVITLSLGVLFVHTSVAGSSMFDVGGSFNIAVPKGEFGDNVDNNGYGFSLEGLYRPLPLVPFKFGLEVGYLSYGREERNAPLSTTIPDLTVQVNTTNNIVLGHLVFRLQEDFGILSPYLDGLVGFSYLYTETSVEDISDAADEKVFSSKNADDLTLSSGIGGGLMIKVYEADKLSLSLLKVYIDLKVRYLYGGEAEYLKEGSISRVGGVASYNALTSETDLMLYQIGVVVGF